MQKGLRHSWLGRSLRLDEEWIWGDPWQQEGGPVRAETIGLPLFLLYFLQGWEPKLTWREARKSIGLCLPKVTFWTEDYHRTRFWRRDWRHIAIRFFAWPSRDPKLFGFEDAMPARGFLIEDRDIRSIRFEREDL